MSEGKWGEAEEKERNAARAKLLEAMPPEARESGEKLLRSCEADAVTAASTITMLACISAGMAIREHRELSFDVLNNALQFYRFACMRELAEHLRAATPGDDALRVISAGLTERARPFSARLKVLLEALKEANEGSKPNASK